MTNDIVEGKSQHIEGLKPIKIAAECCEQDIDCTNQRTLAITKLISDAEEHGRKKEKKAWVDGRRCSECGREIEPSFTSGMCIHCYETL